MRLRRIGESLATIGMAIVVTALVVAMVGGLALGVVAIAAALIRWLGS